MADIHLTSAIRSSADASYFQTCHQDVRQRRDTICEDILPILYKPQPQELRVIATSAEVPLHNDPQIHLSTKLYPSALKSNMQDENELIDPNSHTRMFTDYIHHVTTLQALDMGPTIQYPEMDISGPDPDTQYQIRIRSPTGIQNTVQNQHAFTAMEEQPDIARTTFAPPIYYKTFSPSVCPVGTSTMDPFTMPMTTTCPMSDLLYDGLGSPTCRSATHSSVAPLQSQYVFPFGGYKFTRPNDLHGKHTVNRPHSAGPVFSTYHQKVNHSPVRHRRYPSLSQTSRENTKSPLSLWSVGPDRRGFVNYTIKDQKKLSEGVTRSGGAKTRLRRAREAKEKRRQLVQAIVEAVERGDTDLDLDMVEDILLAR